jgi:hypothetical protein
MWWATLVSSVLFCLLMAAFVFLSLAVTAYVGPVGWAALALSAVFGCTGTAVIIWQSPIGSKRIGETISQDRLDTYSSNEKMGGYDGGRLTGDDDVFEDGSPGKGHYMNGAPREGPYWAVDPVVRVLGISLFKFGCLLFREML